MENIEAVSLKCDKLELLEISETSFMGDKSGTVTEETKDASLGEKNLPRLESTHRIDPPITEEQMVRSHRASIASVNSQSSNSYRERLRQRIQTVKSINDMFATNKHIDALQDKKQAGTSVLSVSSQKKTQLKTKPLQTNFHDLLIAKEESEVEAALERHDETRKKWKNMAHASLEAETAHNFFTKEWSNEQQPEEITDSPIGIQGEEADKDVDEKVGLMTQDYLGLSDEWRQIDSFIEPSIDDPSLRSLRESKLYYYPSDEPVTLEEKLGKDRLPRFIEDEGLFVGTKPSWGARSYNKLQRRLVTEGRKHWFGDDGEVKTVISSSSQNSTDPLLAPIYKSAEATKVATPEARLSDVESYLLELEVNWLSWSHHPLCSSEHVLARRLLDLFGEYTARTQAGLTTRLAGRLNALRTARNKSKQAGDTQKFLRYTGEVREARALWMEEARRDRLTMLNCLMAWRELRTLRTRQGYNVTMPRLTILEQPCPSELVDRWHTELNCQVAERIEEEEEEYIKKFKEFGDNNPKVEGISGRESGGGDRPSTVLRKTQSEVVEEIKAKLEHVLSPPGEPLLGLELSDGPVTPELEINDPSELSRRSALRKSRVRLRVLCGDCMVCQSRPYSLPPSFSVQMNQRISLQLAAWPSSLSLHVSCEGGIGAGKRLTASVFIPIPSSEVAVSEVLEWSCSQRLGPYSHAGVGCGMQGTPHAGGRLAARVAWGSSGPPSGQQQTHHSFKTPRKVQMSSEGLREWAAKAQLDPNDPNNADVLHYMKEESVKEKVNLDVNGHETLPNGDLCNMEDIENNLRLKLLNLRSQVVPEFRDIRGVPIREREIPEDIFSVYEKRVRSPTRTGPGVGETAVGWQRQRSREQLDLLREDILQHCRQTQQLRSLDELVSEEQVPDIGTLGLTFMKWLRPKRPLRPTRKERKKLPVTGLPGQEVEVIVNVVRAFEVPVRADVDPLLENGLSLVPVRPFVEISCQNKRARTTTAEGANPTWNQDLRIPIKVGNRGGENGLLCQLFDEVIVDLLEDERQRGSSIHHRLQRHWLGSLYIPFSSLCCNSRVEGTFPLHSPPVLLGYQRETAPHSSGLRDTTFITLFITVHPPLHPPPPFKERLTCSEQPHVEQHLSEWQAQVVAQLPGQRPPKTLVVDSSAKSVCVTRFFQPLAPPVLEDSEVTTAEMALRFVSKIPVVPGNSLFPGLFDVWLTAQEVISLACADCEALAVLLCCFLLHLGYRAWLLLGCGVPQGSMALVLTRDSVGTCLLWDPALGRHYDSRDTFCPLRQVYSLVNQDNIWVNMQREEAISRTRFDVSRRVDWWPAFGRGVSVPEGSVQPTTLDYSGSPGLPADARLLQDRLEKTLRDSITHWRPTTRTVWNRYVTVKLRQLLPGLERAAWLGDSVLTPPSDHISQLTHTLSSHKMVGFTLNTRFTTVSELVELLRATGLHSIEGPEVEFALAVYVHPFVSNVLSVWTYATALTLRR